MAKKASPKKGKGKKDAASPLKERKRKEVNNDENKEKKDDKSNDDKQPQSDEKAEIPEKATDESNEASTSGADAVQEEGDAEKNSKKRKADDTQVPEESAPKAHDTDNTNDKMGEDAAAEKDDNDDAKPSASSNKPSSDAPVIDLTKPIKKARTAYFIFTDERRAEIQAKHKGEGVAAVAKELGQIWSSMPVEEKSVYQEKAALEREEVAKQLEQLKEAGIDISALPGAATANDNTGPLIFPLARVRKICKLDPEVKGLSKEALLLVTRCAELATSKLGIETVRVAQIQNRRKLLPDDIAQVCQTREQFLFLRDDVKDLVREQVVQKQLQKEKGIISGGNSSNKNSAASKASANSKPLTSYFAAKSS